MLSSLEKREHEASFYWEENLKTMWHLRAGKMDLHCFLPFQYGNMSVRDMIKAGGIEGIHYADGYLSLSKLLENYGVFGEIDEETKMRILVDYKGPALGKTTVEPNIKIEPETTDDEATVPLHLDTEEDSIETIDAEPNVYSLLRDDSIETTDAEAHVYSLRDALDLQDTLDLQDAPFTNADELVKAEAADAYSIADEGKNADGTVVASDGLPIAPFTNADELAEAKATVAYNNADVENKADSTAVASDGPPIALLTNADELVKAEAADAYDITDVDINADGTAVALDDLPIPRRSTYTSNRSATSAGFADASLNDELTISMLVGGTQDVGKSAARSSAVPSAPQKPEKQRQNVKRKRQTINGDPRDLRTEDESNLPAASLKTMGSMEVITTSEYDSDDSDVAKVLSRDVIGHKAKSVEMQAYAMELDALGLHSIPMILQFCKVEHVKEWSWMKFFHKMAFQSWLKSKQCVLV